MPFSAGTRVGAYEITGELGAGGMGEVYRATDTKLGREVAIKTLPAALAGDRERLARFEREAQLLAALSHAHIAAVYGLDEHDGMLYLAMELVEGETLEEKLKAGPLPVDDALRLALQIAEALEAAHDKGVVHRDLKPANVMITPDGAVKVLDFGLAKAFSGNPNEASPAHSPALSMAMTQAGLVLGTAGYMAPEQASGQATDQRADIWAFGVVLYEMLTGLPLFSGESVPHILAAVLQTEPDWQRLPKRLHPRLKLMLERCLKKKPRDRYHAIADARIDIEDALADPAGGAAGGAVGERGAGSPSVRGLVAAIVATAVLAAAVAGAASWYFKPNEPAHVVRFKHELPGAAGFRQTNLPALTVSSDGRRIAYNTSQGVYLLSADQLEARPVPGTEQPLTNLMFSPDGEWLAYVDTVNLQLVKLPIGGGGAVPLTAVASGAFNGATWTVDDWIVFAEASTVFRVPASGGERQVLFDVPTGQAALPQMLPDGETVLLSAQTASGWQSVVQSVDADDYEASFPGVWARYLPSGRVVYGVDDALFARRFDPATGGLGGPVPVVENVLLGGIGPQFAVSASGSLAYVPAGAGAAQDRTLAIVSGDGGVQGLDGIPPGGYSSPRVSPDGKRIVVQTTEGAPYTALSARIWVYDLSGQTAIRPLTPRTGKNFQPIWTPGGERVTFASDRDGSVSIYWQAADGSGVPERLTTAAPGTEQWPDAWSRDGRTLVYQVDSGGNDPDLWMLSLDSPDAPQPLVERPGRQHGAVFSPNGRWVAYGSNEETPQADQIYVQPFPPTGEIYQITQESGAFPVWSPDGSALSYRRGAQGTGGETAPALFEVQIVGDERFAWRDERRLPFEGFLVFGGVRDYDVLPDGQGFVVILSPESAGPTERQRIDVVLNWVEELTSRLPDD